MENRPDSDLDLRKQIAADAADPEAPPSIFLRAGQFFLVPLGIVVACVAVYLFFQYMVSEPGTPKDLIAEIRTGGAVARKHAAHQLVRVILDQARRDQLDQSLVDPVITVFEELPGNEAPTDPVTSGLVGEGPAMRAILARCLALLGDQKKAVPVLLKALKEERNPETMAAFMDALGGLRAPESGQALINLLDHPSTVVRKYAAFNLAVVAAPKKRGETPAKPDPSAKPDPPAVPEALPHLQRKLKDPREEVRWNAALGLAVFLADPSGKEVLLQMLDRAYLEKVIGADKKEAHVDELVKHAMTQACLAATRLKDSSFTDALRRLEKDPDSDVRAAGRMALETLAKN